MFDAATLPNPFPGLRSYEYEDHPVFFGRETHIAELRKKLLANRFLALIGSSGSGKSSLIKAGLIPSLEQLNEEGAADQGWAVLLFKPGTNPVRNLLTAIRSRLRRDDGIWDSRNIDSLGQWVQSDVNAILELLATVRKRNLLLVIDQFEEIFRYEFSENFGEQRNVESRAFIEILLRLITQNDLPIYAVITMRSDYLNYCTDYKGLTEMVNRGYYLLPKMTQSEIRRVILGPAEAYGVDISPDLVSLLLREIAINPDYLPILQHALMHTWERWSQTKSITQPIEIAEYEAIGTIRNSVDIHAESIYNQRFDESRKRATEKLFKTLIVLGPSDTPVLHPTPLSEIVKITKIPDYLLIDVVLVFRENGVSILMPRPGTRVDSEAVIDVTVEQTLTLWNRSKLWIEEELESAKLYKQLSYAAQQYSEGKGALWANPELHVGLKWLNESEPTLEWAQRYDPYFDRAIDFLSHSKREFDKVVQEKEDRQRSELKKARTFAAVLGVSALVSLFFLVVAMVLRTQAEESAGLALEKEKLALFERKRAEEQTKEAISQKKIAQQQRAIAEMQKVLTEEQRLIAVQERENAIRESIAAKAARKVAEGERALAIQARGIALQSQEETEKQRKLAVGAQRDAERQRENAIVAQKDAETARNDAIRQRAKALARFIAVQSVRLPATDELAVLLALQSYRFNADNGGEEDAQDVFNALSKVSDTKKVMLGHTDIVRVIAEPSGKGSSVFFTGGDDGTVNGWYYDRPAQRPFFLQTPNQLFQSIRSLALTSDNKSLLAGTADGRIIKWDEIGQGSRPSQVVNAHDSPVVALLVYQNANGSQLLSVSTKGQLKLWSVSGRHLRVVNIKDLNVEVSCAQLSVDGKTVFLGSGKGSIVRVDLSDASLLPSFYEFNTHGQRISSLGINPNGRQMFFGTSQGTLYSLNLRNGVPDKGSFNGLSGGHTSAITQITYSPDGTRLATSGLDWKIKIWNSMADLSKQQAITLMDFDSWVMGVRFSNDGKKLIGCSADKTVRVWDVDSDELYKTVFRKVKRNMTEVEWEKYIGTDIPYEKIKADVK